MFIVEKRGAKSWRDAQATWRKEQGEGRRNPISGFSLLLSPCSLLRPPSFTYLQGIRTFNRLPLPATQQDQIVDAVLLELAPVGILERGQPVLLGVNHLTREFLLAQF